MENPLIEIKKVSKVFFEGSSFEVRALDSIDLCLEKGAWTYIIGGNGSGKSTLLNVVTGQAPPDKGEVLFGGNSISSLDNIGRFHRFCYVDQHIYDNLIPSLTIYENFVLGAVGAEAFCPGFGRYRQPEIRKTISDVLRRFGLGLEDKIDSQVRFLSGGERQAVMAGKIVYLNPPIMFMDEFTSALDQKLAPKIIGILKDNSRINGNTAVIVTHDYTHIESTADRVIVMDKGRIKGDYLAKDYKLSAHFLLERLLN